MWLNDSDLNAGVLNDSNVVKGKFLIGDHVMDSACSDDEREASAIELAGIADGDHFFGCFDHGAIHASFENVGSGEAYVYIEAVHTEEDNVGVHLSKDVFREWAYDGE